MGIVFRAEDPVLARMVALKVLKPHIATESVRARFLAEARALARINDDNVVIIHQVGEDNGLPFIAMQALPGETLKDRLKRSERLSQIEAVRLGCQVLSGLVAVHLQGLIHRDIKPDNIWIEQGTERCRILDFGLVQSNEGGNLTEVGTVLGTPRFMSPEQANGTRVDHRSDLFSFGCLMYRTVSGRVPFDGKGSASILMAVAGLPETPLENLVPEVDPLLAALIRDLLQKSPSDRPSTAAEALERLQRIEFEDCQDDLLQNRPSAPVNSVSNFESSSKTADASDSQPPGGIRKALSVAGMCCGGGLFILGLLSIIIRITNKDGTVTEIVAPASTTNIEIETPHGAAASTRIVFDRPAPEAADASESPPPAPAGTNDNSLARELITLGAHVSGLDENGEVHGDISDASQVPEEFRVYKVFWQNDSCPTDADYAALQTLEHLETLKVGTRPLSEHQWDTILELQGLRSLFLEKGQHFTINHAKRLHQKNTLSVLSTHGATADPGVFSVLARESSLLHLSIGGDTLRDEDLKELSQEDHRWKLTVTDAPNVTDAGLRSLARISKLEHLVLGNLPGVTAQGLRSLNRLSLTHLVVVNVPGAAVALSSFAEISTLDSLVIRLDEKPAGLPSDLSPLSRLKDLQNLELSGFSLSPAQIATLAGLPSLTFLRITANTQSPATLESLGQLSGLETLHLSSATPDQRNSVA
ncbi:MAG: protein kinase, partial [Planctomycetaceae bacterium]|nr:protein kinase [Planctomycetaceae bacterium]